MRNIQWCAKHMDFWSVAPNILILSALLIGGLACGCEAIYEIKQSGK